MGTWNPAYAREFKFPVISLSSLRIAPDKQINNSFGEVFFFFFQHMGPLQWKLRILTTGPPGKFLAVGFEEHLFHSLLVIEDKGYSYQCPNGSRGQGH